MTEMQKELARIKEEAKNTANGEKSESEELPEGSSPIEARAQDAELEEETAEEASSEDESAASDDGEGEESAEVAAAPGKKIKIGEREFDSEADAVEYAKELSSEVEKRNLYDQGVRDTIRELQEKESVVVAEPVDEDAEFYANPTEKLKKVRAEATAEALRLFKAEKLKEEIWTRFGEEYPDVRRKDADRILRENHDTIGRMTDWAGAMKKVAALARAEYEEIRELTKPRTIVNTSKRPGMAPSGGKASGVTPKKTEEKPLSLAEQLRSIKR
jgi:hypothetical protein